MSTRSWKISVTLVLLIILSGIIFSAVQSRTSFKKLVLDQMGNSQEISSLRLGKESKGPEYKAIEITDEQTIHRIMNALSDIQLSRTSNSNSLMVDDSYWLWIYPKHGPTFKVIINDQNLMRINNSISIHKKYSWTYEAINDFDISVFKDLIDR